MPKDWKKLAQQLTISIAAEVALNFVGLDYMANCMEFILQKHEAYAIAANATQAPPAIVAILG